MSKLRLLSVLFAAMFAVTAFIGCDGSSGGGTGPGVQRDSDLIGYWENNSGGVFGGAWEFKSDGALNQYLPNIGDPMEYTWYTKDGSIHLTLKGLQQESPSMPYGFNSDKTELTLNILGAPLIYTKKSGGGDNGRSFDLGLVGTWELLADGVPDPDHAYVFYSDETFSFNGDNKGKAQTEDGNFYSVQFPNDPLFSYVISSDGNTLTVTSAGISSVYAKKGSIGGGDTVIDSRLVGTWESAAAGTVIMSYTFTNDGSHFLNGETIGYKVVTKNNIIYSVIDGDEAELYGYTISSDGNTLTLSVDGIEIGSYTRKVNTGGGEDGGGSGGDNGGNNSTHHLVLTDNEALLDAEYGIRYE
ncbi:MAG: hypothetical protein FWE57_01645 [Chitinispirillia bacterium]|nr:hypothetical protein [Chitinispirillia bacterium]